MLGEAAFLLVAFGILLNAADQQERSYAPIISCFESIKQPPPNEVQRTPVLVSPNKRYRAYARIDASFDRVAWPACRTKAQLFVSSSKSSFNVVFLEKTSGRDDPAISIGPIAWSPDSRWLAVERAGGRYASDFFGLDFLLYDSTMQKVSTPDVLSAIEKTIGKRCVLGYRSFNGFDASNRLILRVADWQDDNGRETQCIEGTAEWVFDPVTGEVQPSARSNRR